MRKTALIIAVLSILSIALPASGGWQEGVAAFRARNYQAALQEFQAVVQQNPDAYQGHYMVGLTLTQLGRKEEALNSMRKAYDLNPNDLSITLALGTAYFALNRNADVDKLFSTVEPTQLQHAQKVRFYQMRSQARQKTGNPNALDDLAQLAMLLPNDAKTQYAYGTTAITRDQLETGIAALDRAVTLSPNDPDIRRSYASALIKKGSLARDKAEKQQSYLAAAETAAPLTKMTGSYEDAMLQISAELGAGLYPQAITTAQAASRHPGADWRGHFYLGQAYSSNGQFQESIAPLQQALDLAGPSDARQVWRQLGYSYERQAIYDQSVQAYQSAGDQAGVQRVRENQANDQESEIEKMKREAAELEAELTALEGGAGE